MVFTQSQLSQSYGHSTVQAMEEAAEKCNISAGVESYLVKYGTEGELLVSKDLKCACETYKRLKLCYHVMSVGKHRGKASVDFLIKNSQLPSTSVQLDPGENAGKKISQCNNRKGGRMPNAAPSSDEYIVI